MSAADLEAIPGGFLLLAPDATVQSANAAAAALLGRPVDALAGADACGLLDRGEALRATWAALPANTAWRGRRRPRAGRDALALEVLRTANGFSVRVDARPDPLEAIVRGTDFLTRFAHDLRSPVAAVRGALFLLQRHGENIKGTREQRWVRGADQSLGQLDHLLHQTEALTRLARTAPQVARAAADVRELVGVCAARAEGVGTGAPVEVLWPDEVPAEWEVATGFLTTALDELLANAVRHTPSGGSVQVEAAVVDGALQLSVVDAGPGFAPEESDRVFTPFFHSRHTEERGAGLGLCIAWLAVELAGGELAWARRDDRTVFQLRIAA